eukprot:5418801-Pyramimonas_sp.AAC.1
MMWILRAMMWILRAMLWILRAMMWMLRAMLWILRAMLWILRAMGTLRVCGSAPSPALASRRCDRSRPLRDRSQDPG